MSDQHHPKQKSYYDSSRKETIRLDDAKFIHLMALYDELQNRYEHEMQSLVQDDIDDPVLVRDEVQHWNDTVSQVRNAIREMRSVPVKKLFFRFKRIVADLAKYFSTPIVLRIEGEDVEVDKYSLDEIGEVLLWWIRNTVDRGFEPPDVRCQQGKPPEGTLTLKAYRHEKNVIIEMADDGKGIDTERLDIQVNQDGSLDFGRESLLKCSQHYLGLDMIIGLLDKFGIELTVQSRLYKGTVFKLELPYELPKVSSGS